ncbi:hypothetical protein BGX27_010734 [Mortierella sp. AM989]|nr:hypothetical protein BGX27_010734 [Mortierella sp. AM989]
MLPSSFLKLNTAIYEWTKECPPDLKRDLDMFLASNDFLDRPNIFFKGIEDSSKKWVALISVAGAESSRQMASQRLGYQFMELHQDETTTFSLLSPAPRMPVHAAYNKFLKDIIKANKIDRTKAKVEGWKRTLDRAAEMVAAAPQQPPSSPEDSNSTDTTTTTAAAVALPPSTLLTSLKPGERSAASYGMWFISVDIESFERDHSKILEIGWSVWDSRMHKFADRHYAISEYRHLKNGKFVNDRRDRYIFGETVWARLNECIAAFQADLDMAAKRNSEGLFALIAHDMSSDEAYLKGMGIVFPEGMVKFDTMELNCARVGDAAKVGLGKSLDELNIDNYSLHNAGNDAHYTLELFLWLARNHLTQRSLQ